VQNEGFQREDIVYEKFTLSLQEAYRLAEEKERRFKDLESLKENKNAEDLMRFLGTDRLRKVFSERFFAEFDRLAELNKGIPRVHGRRPKRTSNVNVDLMAIRHKPGACQVRFCEVKKYRPNGNHDPIFTDQLLLLGFVHYIVGALKERAFKATDRPYEVRTDLAVFVPKGFPHLLDRVKTKDLFEGVEFAV
jgi:hypothetical protein